MTIKTFTKNSKKERGPEPKTRRVVVYMTETTYQRLRKVCRDAKVSMTQWFRRQLL